MSSRVLTVPNDIAPLEYQNSQKINSGGASIFFYWIRDLRINGGTVFVRFSLKSDSIKSSLRRNLSKSEYEKTLNGRNVSCFGLVHVFPLILSRWHKRCCPLKKLSDKKLSLCLEWNRLSSQLRCVWKMKLNVKEDIFFIASRRSYK